VSTPVFQILETGTPISGQLLGAVATVLIVFGIPACETTSSGYKKQEQTYQGSSQEL